jgi:hypothetical protein
MLTGCVSVQGVEGMGSGVGFCVNDMQLNMAALYHYEDRGFLETLRPQWIQFIQQADGFVFVVDHQASEEALAKARKELHSLLPSTQTSPLLVIACSGVDIMAAAGTPDTFVLPPTSIATTTSTSTSTSTAPLPTPPHVTASLTSTDVGALDQSETCQPSELLSPVEIAGKLGLLNKSIQRCWSVHCIDIGSFSQISHAIDWLCYALM